MLPRFVYLICSFPSSLPYSLISTISPRFSFPYFAILKLFVVFSSLHFYKFVLLLFAFKCACNFCVPFKSLVLTLSHHVCYKFMFKHTSHVDAIFSYSLNLTNYPVKFYELIHPSSFCECHLLPVCIFCFLSRKTEGNKRDAYTKTTQNEVHP